MATDPEPVYGDTNVLNHLHEQKGLSASDVITVRRAARQKRFRLLASDVLIDETLATFSSDSSKARGLLTLLLELCEVRNSTILHHELLLGGDIRAFYGAGVTPDRFMDPAEAARLSSRLKRLADGRTDYALIAAAQSQAKKEKREFRNLMRDAKKDMEERVAKLPSAPSFDQFRNLLAPQLLGTLALALGVGDECLAQGIIGLMKVRTVQAFLGYTTSMLYAQTVEAKAPKYGDSNDQIHAFLATVADIFVSTDGDLRAHVIRSGIPNLEVLDLPEFIDRIR